MGLCDLFITYFLFFASQVLDPCGLDIGRGDGKNNGCIKHASTQKLYSDSFQSIYIGVFITVSSRASRNHFLQTIN